MHAGTQADVVIEEVKDDVSEVKECINNTLSILKLLQFQSGEQTQIQIFQRMNLKTMIINNSKNVLEKRKLTQGVHTIKRFFFKNFNFIGQ